MPVCAEALDDQRRGGADRVEGRAHRELGLDRADVVVVEDLDDLGLLDARHALRLLGVVDQQHAAAGAGSRDPRGVTSADGPAAASTTTAAR